LVPESENDGGAAASNNENAWLGLHHGGDAEGAFDFFECRGDGFDKVASIEGIDEMGEDLSVCFGKEDVSVSGEFIAEGAVVFNDAVVDEGDAIFTAGVWVGIFLSGRSVGGPASVGDAAGRAVEIGVFLKEGDEFTDFSFFFPNGDVARGFYGDTGGVIASVFETLEARDEDGDGWSRA